MCGYAITKASILTLLGSGACESHMPSYRLKRGSCQDGFAKSRAKIQIFGGAFGNGKTTGMTVKGIRCAIDYPGSVGLVARATYPKLNDSIRKVYYKWMPPKYIRKYPTQEDNTMYLKNGSEIHFRYIAQRGKQAVDGATTSNLLSNVYDYIIVDQMEDPEITYKDFLDLLGRLRGEAPYRGDPEDPTMPSTGPRFLMIGMNPTRNWIYRQLIQPMHLYAKSGIKSENLLVDPATGEPIMELYESDVYANADNLPKDYITTNEIAYKGQMRERYLMGNWEAYEGLVYSAFDVSHNIMSREAMLEHLYDCIRRHVKVKVVEGYDFGIVKPSCYLLGFVDDWGRLFILDGYYQPEFHYNLQPAAIHSIRARYSGYLQITEPILADPAIFRKQVIVSSTAAAAPSETIARLLSNMGLKLRPGSNDVITGIAKCSTYFAGLPHLPCLINDGILGGALIYIAQELPWYLDEISAYYWKKNLLGQHLDEPQDSNDHAMDATKYMLTRLPEASDIRPPEDELPKGYMFWHEMETKDYNEAMRTKH